MIILVRWDNYVLDRFYFLVKKQYKKPFFKDTALSK